MKKEIDIFDKPENIKLMLRGFYVLLVLLILADVFFIENHHPYFGWDGANGFFAAFGFVACVMVITISKILRYFLIRGNDYYGDE